MRARDKTIKRARDVGGSVVLRPAKPKDIAALRAIEDRAFTHDRLSARSFARFLRSQGASLIVADMDGVICGYTLTLFRKHSRIARLYSIAVDATIARRNVGSSLLKAAEAAALQRRANAMRLEVKPANRSALGLYRKFRYRVVGELEAYYEDGGKALRLEKPLAGSVG